MGDLFCEQNSCTTGTGFSHWITADIATLQDHQNDIHATSIVIEGERVAAAIVDLYSRGESGTQDYANLTQLTISDSLSNSEFGSSLFRASIVPVPAAVWLFGSGLLGLVGMARRRKAV